ncbi:hypothetical protein SAMN05421595_2439 [Austwickia chelonae]|uniref:Uncharacterized protein n=1 Tax=Austwickia chelonae NBRC 105200 TaxID=1184607 RepID=K6VTW2_9MICO|nr:hypothetical protein [Austwickia chelonae]GAB78785.1 hypothetical protein AUCHE_16_02100 [Austwickia chelonae NBRC 105200]SEW35401.1 hypothetical protein SAMN05421595_2439 [Austwickia chelonae]
MSVHLLLLTSSCCALAAAAAGSPLTGASVEEHRARQLTLLVASALVVGNAVCLLPETPAWYSAALVALTAAGLVWSVVSLVGARRLGRRGGPAEVTSLSGGAPAPALSSSSGAASHLTVVQCTPTERIEARRSLDAARRPHLAILPGGAGDTWSSGAFSPSHGPQDPMAWDEGVRWEQSSPGRTVRRGQVESAYDAGRPGHGRSRGVRL